MKSNKPLIPLGIALLIVGLAVALVSGCGYVNAKAKSKGPHGQFNKNAETLILGLQQYKEFTGAYPVGSNLSITKAMMGKNDKQVLILAIRQSDLNDRGEVLDPWGTPYRFYFSGSEVLIRSAGPNRVWEDDHEPESDDLYRSTLTKG